MIDEAHAPLQSYSTLNKYMDDFEINVENKKKNIERSSLVRIDMPTLLASREINMTRMLLNQKLEQSLMARI